MLETFNNNQHLDSDPAFIPRIDQSETKSLFCPTPIKPTSPHTSPKKKKERTRSLEEGLAASQEIFNIFLSNMIKDISYDQDIFDEEDDDFGEMEFEECFGCGLKDENMFDDNEYLNNEKKIGVRSVRKSNSTPQLRFVWNHSPPPKVSSSLNILHDTMTPPLRTSNPLPQNSSFWVIDSNREGAEVGLLSLSPPPL